MSRPNGERAGQSIWSLSLLAVIAVGLLAGPLWVEVAHLDDRVYEYERVEVTTQGGTIQYEVDDPGVQISEDIACSGAIVSRACYLERGLIGNATVPTSKYSNTGSSIDSKYRFVAGSEATYEVDSVLNRSQGYIVENWSVKAVEEDAYPDDRVLYRVELDLEQVSSQTVLEQVSVDVESLDKPVREAARTGSVRTYSPAENPATPVKLEDGSIYRVYLTAEYGPPESARLAVVLLRYVAPIAGLIIGYPVLKRLLQDRSANF